MSRPSVHVHHTHTAPAPARLVPLLQHVLAHEGCTKGSVTVILTGHATVLDLNRTYLAHDYFTDVLAFAYHDAGEPLDGEIYIDLDTALERHTDFGTTFDDEVCRYAVHGLLHLLGYSDATPAQKAAMRTREDQYLAAHP